MSDSAPSTSSSAGTTSPASSPSGEGWLGAAGLALGRFVFRYRNALAPSAVGLTLAATVPLAFGGDDGPDLALDAFGILVALAGQALRVLVIGLAYIKRGGRDKTIAADRLVCEGVFAHSRNPLYLGNILLITGLLLIWNSPVAYVVVLSVVTLSFFSIVRTEETFLRSRFGAEYEIYCARVNRFLPDFRGFGQTLNASTST
jgi:protein-S-isoprenylcysteine O-methyltransferase Ste14